MKNLLAVLLLLSGIATTANAQNLSTMSEKDRNEKLVKEAKTAIKKYAPDYVRYTKGKYVIVFYDDVNLTGVEEAIYSVKFTDYDRNEESFSQGYPVAVDFRVEDGSLASIFNGNGFAILIPAHKTRGQEIPKLEYKKRPPYKQNADGSWSFS